MNFSIFTKCGVYRDMRHIVFITALFGFAQGCGNLSNDDLLFLNAIPKAKEVELVVKDNPQVANALVGEAAESYQWSVAVSEGINVGVAGLLDFVDSLGKDHPPTKREENKRIWGPIKDIDNSGFTLRLEIQRQRLDNDAPRYVFCLHVGQDSDVTGKEPSCTGPDEVSGLSLILWGFFDPTAANGTARTGKGEVHLDFEASRTLGFGKPDDRGLFNVLYDFSNGGSAKHVQIDWEAPADFVTEFNNLSYDYALAEDGWTSFFFQFDGNADHTPLPLLETHTVTAYWKDDVAGRADVQIQGGDIPAGEQASFTECWDAFVLRTYAKFEWNGATPILFIEGDIGACPQNL